MMNFGQVITQMRLIVFMTSTVQAIFPAIATASHISSSPNHQTGMSLPLKFRVDVAMSGRLGMELQPHDITGRRLFCKQSIDTYKIFAR